MWQWKSDEVFTHYHVRLKLPLVIIVLYISRAYKWSFHWSPYPYNILEDAWFLLGGAVILPIKPPAGRPLLIYHLQQIVNSIHNYPAIVKAVFSIFSLRSIAFTCGLLLCSEYFIIYRKNNMCTCKAWILKTGVHPWTPVLDICYCIRPAQPFVLCGKLWQNLVCLQATWNPLHRMKNEYVCI